MVRNLRAGRFREGGSTITQQLAKTSFLSPDRTVIRKAQEALIALWLEALADQGARSSAAISPTSISATMSTACAPPPAIISTSIPRS